VIYGQLLYVNVVYCSYYAKLKKDEEEREKELAKKYRDRVSQCSYTVDR